MSQPLLESLNRRFGAYLG